MDFGLLLNSDHRCQPGDVLGFSSWSWLGVGINVCTLGVPFYGLSHVGLVIELENHPWSVLCESTTLYREPCLVAGKNIDGVQFHKIKQRVRSYKGLVWMYPIATSLPKAQREELTRWCLDRKGLSYDALGALGARDTLLGCWLRKPEDLTSLFCSELVIAGLKHVGVVPADANSSAMSPNRCGRSLTAWGTHRRPIFLKSKPCRGGR